MIAYIRSTLLSTAVVGVVIAAAWMAGPAAVNASSPTPQAISLAASTEASPLYFMPAAHSAAAPLLHTTSARLDQRYALRAQVAKASAGLDPAVPLSRARLARDTAAHSTLTLAEALAQADHIAAARGLDPTLVRALVNQYTEHAPLGLGTPAVNVPLLNLALDALEP